MNDRDLKDFNESFNKTFQFFWKVSAATFAVQIFVLEGLKRVDPVCFVLMDPFPIVYRVFLVFSILMALALDYVFAKKLLKEPSLSVHKEEPLSRYKKWMWVRFALYQDVSIMSVVLFLFTKNQWDFYIFGTTAFILCISMIPIVSKVKLVSKGPQEND